MKAVRSREINGVAMQVEVDFEEERLALELPPEKVVAAWRGPEGMSPTEAAAAIRAALEQPLEFPPFRQIFVPGDRVTIAIDVKMRGAGALLGVIREILAEAGVDEGVTVVALPEASAETLDQELPTGMTLEVHDPDDRTRLAYLATTREGRRIYLNRQLTDADVVVPTGRMGFDPVLGYRGPWSVLFPGTSDRETASDYRRMFKEDHAGREFPEASLQEPLEVSWLLGTQFQLGIVPGLAGPAQVIAGAAEAVRDQGIQAINRLWSFRPDSRAEMVVVGVGSPGRPAGLDDMVQGLVTASRLVQHGGKIVALSRATGPIGPSFQRLMEAGDPRKAQAALQGHDDDADSILGRRLAKVVSWADVYLLSGLDRQVVEDLLIVPLDRPEDAGRLVGRSGSSILVSQAELTRASMRNGELE